MGLFNFVLKGMGFEGEEVSHRTIIKPRQKTIVKKQNNYESFNLHNKKQTLKQQLAMSENNSQLNNLVVYAPKTHEDVQHIVECLKNKEACICNFAQIDEEDSLRVLDFLSGGVFALNGQINRVQDDLFLITHEGINIKRN